jgi:hypothetical protein
MGLSGALSRMLKQTVTYWSPGVKDEFGDITWGTPVTMNARWEDKIIVFFDAEGEEQHSRSIVYTVTDVANGGWMFLGTSAAADPKTVTGADRIRQVMESPDYKGRVTVWKIIL